MRLVKEIEINENGQLFLGPEMLEMLELIEAKVRCILDKGQITLLSTKRTVEKLVDEVIAETEASSMRDMGKVMGVIMPKVKGKADGKPINKIERERLSQ